MVTDDRAGVLQGLADPTRWRILQRLSSGGLAVSEIAADFPMSRPAVSKHLRVLREAGLVVERKEGRRRIYELVADPLEEMAAGLERLAARGGALRRRATAPGAAASRDRREPEREPAAPARERAAATARRSEDDEDRWRSW